MKYIFIRDNADEWPVRVQCTVLEVTPSGYYAWKNNPMSRRAEKDAKLRPIIQRTFDT